MSDVNITINGNAVVVPSGTTILEAAKIINIKIPTLCHLDIHDLGAVNQVASCRVCVVEVVGYDDLLPACNTEVLDGMIISTTSVKAVLARRAMVELLLSDHPTDCLICEKNMDCELQSVAAELSIRTSLKYPGQKSLHEVDDSSKAIFRNPNKCIMCRRCETMCSDVQTCNVLTSAGDGFDTVIQTKGNLPLVQTDCTFCGQCVSVCPTAALTEVNRIAKVWSAINNPKKHVIVQTAPATRVALGEAFGLPAGSIVTGKMVSLLRKIGFDKVYDTNFAADLAIMEEATEMIKRIKEDKDLPILTSCCPAWVNFIERNYPDLLYMPSTCKSPHQMFGIIAKTYYAEKIGIDPEDIVVVSVMPCVAKKYEATRKELRHNKLKDVDYVITTRELAMMAGEACINFNSLPDSEFDELLGESSGAGNIFATTGGVIEATMRTAHEWITGEELEEIEYKQLRGLEGVREATITIDSKDFNIAIAHGLGNARKVLDAIQKGEKEYHAIEIMACPGGCIGGGGQPYHKGDSDIIKLRQQAIYNIDKNKVKRKSHENKQIKKLYDDFLGEPGGEKAHELLHTYYKAKKKSE